MKTHSESLTIKTEGKGTYEITSAIISAVKRSGTSIGQATIFLQHTSASLVVFENADHSARTDLEAFFERLVPEHTDYLTHTAEGPDDSTSHIKSALTRSSEVLPIRDGALQLGTWQGIFLFEHRRAPHIRKIIVTVLGD